MQCRKRLSYNKRCVEKAHNDSTCGYCQYHWHRYQIGLDFHDPSQDYDYEEPFLEELFNNVVFEDVIIDDKTSKNIDLEEFSKDKQNIHTKPLVDIVLERATKLIELSKKSSYDEHVFFYLLSENNLSDKAKETMNSYFYSEDSIYDLPKPTYRMVLQGLWVYINNKPYEIRNEMIERLKQELEDNVETCAQGNLSRLTNVLNGYDTMSITPEISLSDKMAQISKEKDPLIRKSKAIESLKKYKVSKDEYEAWMDAIESC